MKLLIGISGKHLCPVCYSDIEATSTIANALVAACSWCDTVTAFNEERVIQIKRAVPKPDRREVARTAIRKICRHPHLGNEVARRVLDKYGAGAAYVSDVPTKYLDGVILACGKLLAKFGDA